MTAGCDVAQERGRAGRPAGGVMPPTSRGTSRRCTRRIARVDPLGGEREVEVAAATSPDRSSSSRNGPLVVPGNVVDCRTTSWPARSCVADEAAARRTGPRSGPWPALIGVGTQTKIASTGRGRPRRYGHAEATLEPGPKLGVADVVDRRATREQLVDAGLVRVDADDVQTGLDERQGERQADVARGRRSRRARSGCCFTPSASRSRWPDRVVAHLSVAGQLGT